MAHPEQMLFVDQCRRFFPEWFTKKRVLEIGSLNVNGTVRGFFLECEYTGIDVAPGPGVDVVMRGENMLAPAASFDVVVSCEALEHDPLWDETFGNAQRMLRPDGLLIMTCASLGRQQHGTRRSKPADSPLMAASGSDYYRNLEESDFATRCNINQGFCWSSFFNDHVSRDLYFIGLGKALVPMIERAETFQSEFGFLLRRKNVFGEW